MYDFHCKQQVHKYIGGKIEKNYTDGEPKVYTVEFVDRCGVKLYHVPYAVFNHGGEVEHIDTRRCGVVLVNDRTKTANRNTWHTWIDANIKPVEATW